MMRYKHFLILIVFFSCSSNEEPLENSVQKEVSQDSLSSKNNLESEAVAEDIALWADSLILNYLKQNPEIKSPDENPITYIKEEQEREDHNYIAVRIGRSFEDHYTTERWIYIDEKSKEIYNYDVPNDSLILWKQ